MCRSDAESISHLLLHCPMAYQLWIVALTFFWYVACTARYGCGCTLELKRGASGKETETGLNLGSSLPYVVDLARA